jgi:hypothetical protein
MSRLLETLGCGTLQLDSKTPKVTFVVTKFSDIENIIFPFFEKFPIEGIKRLDYVDFCQIVMLMRNKAHLTEEGLANIREIKAGMNRNRSHSSS